MSKRSRLVIDMRQGFWWVLHGGTALIREKIKKFHNALCVYNFLCEHANDQRTYENFKASREVIAKGVDLGVTAVGEALKQLEEIELIEGVRNNDPKTGSCLPNGWSLFTPTPPPRQAMGGSSPHEGGTPRQAMSYSIEEEVPKKGGRAYILRDPREKFVTKRKLDEYSIQELEMRYYPLFDSRHPRYHITSRKEDLAQLKKDWERSHKKPYQPLAPFSADAYLRGDYGDL